MKVEVEDINSVKKRLHVVVPREDVARELQGAFRKLSKEATIKGFRKGKIPKKILEKHFGEKIESEVTNKLITSTFIKALENKKVDPVSRPEISAQHLKEGQVFKYSATFEITPQIKVEGYKGLVVESKDIEVTEKEVEENLEALRDRHAQWKETENGELIKGNLAIIDFEGFVDGKPMENGTSSDFSFEVGSGTFFPAFEDQVVGMKIGETKELNVRFPEDYNNSSLVGKDAVFNVSLKGIKEKTCPNIDDDFAKDLQSKDLKELKKKIEENLVKQKETDEKRRWRAEVMKKLFEINPFELPPSLVEEHFNGLVNDSLKSLKKQGLSDDKLNGYVEGMKNQYRGRAETEVRNGIILKAMAEQESVDVSQEDIDLKLSEMASLFGETVENLKRFSKDNQFLNNIKQQIVEDKLFNLIGNKEKGDSV
jgi:trigger factor